jgi:hypothetical protein
MASLIDAFHRQPMGGVRWSEIANRLLDEAPEPVSVLKQFVMRIQPSSWSGSRAAVIEERLELLKEMQTHSDPSVASYATQESARLMHEVEEEKRDEKTRIKMFDQTFE